MLPNRMETDVRCQRNRVNKWVLTYFTCNRLRTHQRAYKFDMEMNILYV